MRLLVAIVNRRPMADFDDHDDELIFADSIDNSPPCRTRYRSCADSFTHPLSAWIIAQSLNMFQDTRPLSGMLGFYPVSTDGLKTAENF